MFRRKWSGLPKDAEFPSDLKGLGYFINDDDEIRSIENPDYYFKFFLNKNTRINDRQRFEFNDAMRKVIFERLEKEGLKQVNLPLGTPSAEPHVPIFVSPDLEKKSHVVIVLGEPTQCMGMLAGRVANGVGGLNKGSIVSVVRGLKEQVSSSTDDSSPGIVLANMGQRFWWPEGKRALTIVDSSAIPLPSLVHAGRRHVQSVNDIPGSETPFDHLQTLFKQIVSLSVAGNAKISIIAVQESCDVVERFFDDKKNWDAWGPSLNAMALLGNVYTADHLTNDGLKEFLAKRACSFLVSDEPRNTPIAPPLGNPNFQIEALGTPCYSSGETWCSELILPSALDIVLEYLQEVALAPDFENEPIVVRERPPPTEDMTEDVWKDVPDEDKPSISKFDYEGFRAREKAVKKQAKKEERLRRFVETGERLDSSDDESEVEEVEEVFRPEMLRDWDDV